MRTLSDAPLFLIGYRGTGKTTAAQHLAKRLGWPWVDTDAEIEQRAGRSIAAIFAEEGEPAFRDWEERVVKEMCDRRRLIVALGGGAVIRAENRRVICAAGPVILLTASVESILQRLGADPTTTQRRPNLTKAGGRAEITALLDERLPLYLECATFEVDTEGRTPDEIVDEILARL